MTVLARSVARNAVYGGFARLVTLIAGLLLTPYLLSHLGAERFAVWALVSVVTGAFGLFDLSLRTGFVRHLSETLARRDLAAVSAVISTGFAFYLAFSALAFGVFFLLRRPILELLELPPSLQREASEVFAIGLASYLSGSLFTIFAALCDARQRMDLTHGLGVVSLLVTVAATVGAVESGLGLRGVALAQLLGVLLFHLSVMVASRRLVRGWRLSPRLLSWPWFRRLVRFGSILHVSTTCGVVNRQLDKLLLSHWAGLPTVTSYELAARMAVNAGSFQPYLSAALLPAASHLETLGKRGELVRIYRRASRYLFFLGLPPFVFLAVNAESLMVAWIGRPEPLAAAVLLLLAGGYLVNSLSNGMAFVCQGMDRPDLQARQSAVQLAVNAAGSLLLLRLIGPLGAPLGTTLALVVGAAVFARSFHPLLGVSTAGLLREAGGVPLLAALAGAGAGVLAAGWVETGDRAGALLALTLHGLTLAAVYLAICAASGFVRASELRRLLAALRARVESFS